MLQSILPSSKGTNETIHAAVCVGHNENNIPIMANICGSGLKTCVMGEGKFGKNYGINRPCLIFRTNDKAAMQLAKTINKDTKNKKFSYSLIRFIKTLGKNKLDSNRISRKERIISENTFVPAL